MMVLICAEGMMQGRVDMMMQGQGAVKTSWQAVDEWCICVRRVAMWSGSIREGFRGYTTKKLQHCYRM